MKISIFYREIKLGELKKTENNYVYKALPENVEKAHKKGYSTFLYMCDNSFISEELPFSLLDFIPDEKQVDLIIAADIKESDSDFEKLYKIASLDAVKPDFHMEIE